MPTDRSPHWRALRRAHLKVNPGCAACGSKILPEVHHVIPFHLAPDLELDAANLLTLCRIPFRRDHFHVGHHDNWEGYNPNVVRDADLLLIARTGR